MLAPHAADSTSPSATPRIQAFRWRRLPSVSRVHGLQPQLESRAALAAGLARAASDGLSETLQVSLKVEIALHPSLHVPGRSFAHHTVFFLFDGPVGRPSVLELDGDGAIDLARRLIGGTAEPSKPCGLLPLERAALTHLGLTCLRRLSPSAHAATTSGLRLLAVADRRDHALAHLERESPHGVFDLALQLADAPYHGRFWVPAETLSQLGGPVATPPPATEASISMRALCVVATRPTSLAGVSRGDVVTLGLVPRSTGHLTGPMHLRARGFTLTGIAGTSGFTVSEVHTHAPRSPAMTHASPDESTAIEDVPISVEVELARLAVPFGALAGTRTGTVVPLHISPIAPITLRIEGRKFALAELVELEGELGARILEVYP